jgi:hypothetical protein
MHYFWCSQVSMLFPSVWAYQGQRCRSVRELSGHWVGGALLFQFYFADFPALFWGPLFSTAVRGGS